MSTISLRVPEQELNLFRDYAKINNKTLSEVIRSIMLEHIEDEYDMRVIKEYEKEKAEGKIKTQPHDNVWKELGI